MADEKELSIDESFRKLDQIIDRMQSQDLSLEETFRLYQQGVSLVESCNQKIGKIQCDIQLIAQTSETDGMQQ